MDVRVAGLVGRPRGKVLVARGAGHGEGLDGKRRLLGVMG